MAVRKGGTKLGPVVVHIHNGGAPKHRVNHRCYKEVRVITRIQEWIDDDIKFNRHKIKALANDLVKD